MTKFKIKHLTAYKMGPELLDTNIIYRHKDSPQESKFTINKVKGDTENLCQECGGHAFSELMTWAG